MNTQFELIFHKLATRLRNENNLSDLTWAFCEIEPEFKFLFLKFFFREIKKEDEINLLREYSQNKCRPDFYFKIGSLEYIIEVKNYDRNDHFMQYGTEFRSAKFGWIANYKGVSEGVECRTWSSFYKVIETQIREEDIEDGVKIIYKSYLAYLKSVCSIVNHKSMKLTNLSSLFTFNQILPKVIEIPIESLKCSLYYNARSFYNDRSGYHIKLQRSDTSSDSVYLWFGIFYSENDLGIGIAVQKNNCHPIYDHINLNLIEGVYFDKTKYDRDEDWGELYWFIMKKEYFERLNDIADIDKQTELIRDFFIDVIDSIREYLPK